MNITYIGHQPAAAVVELLVALNYTYGRGTVTAIEFNETVGVGYVTTRLQYGTTRRQFTLKDRRLRFLTVRRTLAD